MCRPGAPGGVSGDVVRVGHVDLLFQSAFYRQGTQQLARAASQRCRGMFLVLGGGVLVSTGCCPEQRLLLFANESCTFISDRYIRATRGSFFASRGRRAQTLVSHRLRGSAPRATVRRRLCVCVCVCVCLFVVFYFFGGRGYMFGGVLAGLCGRRSVCVCLFVVFLLFFWGGVFVRWGLGGPLWSKKCVCVCVF